MENTDLKEQFLLLQAQQQQKLLERRKKKEKANKVDNKTEYFGSVSVNDNLGLKTTEPSERSCSSQVLEELVDHLNDQIRQLKDENGRFYKLLSEKDFEIRQTKKKFDEIKITFGDGGVTNETAATKIIELSKKIREMTAEKEADKTKYKQLQKKVLDLQQQMQTLPAASEVSLSSAAPQTNNKDDDGVDVKALQDRLKQSETRVTDFRNQCQTLRQELKVAHKVLSQEIGENVNVQALLNDTSSWRGRAQQIITLQQKVDELRSQLEGPASDKTPGGVDKLSAVRRKQEEKYKEELRKIEKEKKEAQENAGIKVINLETENQSLKDKLDAAKMRIKVLTNEIKTLKAQVETLLRKSRNDDEFIDALMKQQSQMKSMLDTHNQQQLQQQQLQQQQLQHMSVKSQQDSNIVEQLKTIAAQKEAQVKKLESELHSLKMIHIQNRSLSADPFSNTASPQATVLFKNSRPQTAVISDAVTSRDQKTIDVYQQELSTLRYHHQELEVMSQALEVEKDRMKELVQTLQNRLSDETQKLCETQEELQAQKRQMVEMEKRLARQNLEANKRKSASKGVSSARDDGGTDNFPGLQMDKSELLARLQISKDENESLKTALQQTIKSKQEDLKVYSSTLEETKQVFLQALKQMKSRFEVS